MVRRAFAPQSRARGSACNDEGSTSALPPPNHVGPGASESARASPTQAAAALAATLLISFSFLELAVRRVLFG